MTSQQKQFTAVDSQKFQFKVVEHLITNTDDGKLSLQDVASHFNMTPRSLQRRLQKERATFQHLVNLVRKSIALQYLQSGKYQLKEISSMLGYNEVSSFSRAFKRWTGCAPNTVNAETKR